MFIPRLYLPTTQGDESADPRPIDDFFAARVVVVLGDPGQGKTEAFKQAAKIEPDAVFVPLRQFLHLNVERWRGKILYLDGLDEQRAKLKGRDVLAEIVARLDELGCPRVRLSCRTPDWHGGSDLSILADVAQGDTVRQLLLLPLAPGGIRAIVQDSGPDADSFLSEAERHDVAALFGNPQVLELFIETVGCGGGWPATRKELMETAIGRMLEEANEEHERTATERIPDPALLQEAADRVAALILLAGQEGVALGPAGRAEGFPDLRTVAGEWAEAMTVAGRRRVFRADAPEQAAPRHRMLAEFMAARYLAGLIRKDGLPLRRALALLTASDGGALSDLRGLYAWLVTLLPEHAAILLERDPLGAIHYGDVASWPVAVRRHALAALGNLERIDPYYRTGLWGRAPLAGLAHPDLTQEFCVVLKGPSGTTLGIVLHALAAGTPVPALASDLLALIQDSSRPIKVREAAVAAFAHADPERLRELVTVLADLDAGRLNDERTLLRQELIEHLYPSVLSAADLVRHLSPRGHTSDPDAYDDFGYHIARVVVDGTVDGDLPALADALGDPVLQPAIRHAFWWRNLLTALYRRMIAAGAFDADPARLDRWLRLAEDEYDHANLEGDARTLLREFFNTRPDRFRELFVEWVKSAPTDPGEWWLAWHRLRERTAAPLPSDFGQFALNCLADRSDGRFDEQLFELAAAALIEADQPVTGQPLDSLFAFVADHPRYESRLSRVMVCSVADWRVEQAKRRGQYEQRQRDRRDAQRRLLTKDAEVIRTGKHLAALDDFALVWFGHFSNVDREAAPRDRLATEIGEDLADVMIEGFVALQRRDDLPTLAEHLKLQGEHQRHRSAFPLIAGLDHLCDDSCSALEAVPDHALHSALAAHFVVDHGKDRVWPNVVIDRRPDVALPLLSILWRDQLDRGKWPEGLYELAKSTTPLARALRDHALDLLAYKAGADAEVLRPLLGVAADDQPADLRDLALRVLTSTPALEDSAAVTWAAETAKLAPETFGPILVRHAAASTDGWWSLRFAAEPLFDHWPLSLQATVLRTLLSGLAPVPATIGVRTVGHYDPEEASRVLDTLIDRIARRKEPEAGAALVALRDDPACSAWRKALAHAVCVQAQVRRDAEFDYATLEQVANVLANGPPAGIRDLQALVLDHLDDLGTWLVRGDADGWRQVWNTAKGKTTTPKAENDARDVLLALLQSRLAPKGVSAEREGDFASHKRADIVVRHRLDKLPIEIKRCFHPDVWNAADWQLAGQYASDPDCQGHGIYLVLWFGPVKGYSLASPPDGLARPKSAQEMERSLRQLADRAGLSAAIAIRVIDCGKSGG